MRVHLLRHGESLSNAAPGKVALDDREGDRLTDRGRAQAAAAAEHLGGRGITRLVASPMRRARETAAPIAERLGLEIETREDIRELRESHGYGELSGEEQRLRRWHVWMAEHGHDPDYSYEGGESFNSLRARIESAKSWLAGLPDGERPLLVTHGIFLRFFLLHSLRGEGFTASQVGRLGQLRSHNCGLSAFDAGRPSPDYPSLDDWTCVTWMERPWDLP